MIRFLAFCLLVLTARAAEPATLRTFVLGDWGWADPEMERLYPVVRQNAEIQRAVAKAMAGLDASRLARVCEEHDLPVEDANRALLMMLGGTVRENAMVHEADLLD
mgnify:CR=1 FL=1